MTPAEEAAFIALWTEGLTCPAIIQRLNIPPGTARSRAYTLQQQGKLTHRPRGGRRAPARREGTPAWTPAPLEPSSNGRSDCRNP
jgi:transposase